MKITVNIETSDIVGNIERQDAKTLIQAIDSKFAEVDFTLEIIKGLIDSLHHDLSLVEIANELGFQLKP